MCNYMQQLCTSLPLESQIEWMSVCTFLRSAQGWSMFFNGILCAMRLNSRTIYRHSKGTDYAAYRVFLSLTFIF